LGRLKTKRRVSLKVEVTSCRGRHGEEGNVGATLDESGDSTQGLKNCTAVERIHESLKWGP